MLFPTDVGTEIIAKQEDCVPSSLLTHVGMTNILPAYILFNYQRIHSTHTRKKEIIESMHRSYQSPMPEDTRIVY